MIIVFWASFVFTGLVKFHAVFLVFWKQNRAWLQNFEKNTNDQNSYKVAVFWDLTFSKNIIKKKGCSLIDDFGKPKNNGLSYSGAPVGAFT